MATGVTAGAALLVRQYFMDSKFWGALCGDTRNTFCQRGSFEPSGYLMKALFLHSGGRVSRYSHRAYGDEVDPHPAIALESPPDNFQGYGAVTLTNILPLADGRGLQPPLSLYIYDKLNMTAHSTCKSSVTFTGGGKGPLKVTIAWFDPPSIIGSVSSLLIHDVDLVVRTPDGEIHWGNENYRCCDRATQRRGQRDTKNPSEQVYIPHIRCGTSSCKYDVFIRVHALFAKPSQNVALVITSSGTVTDPEATMEWFGSEAEDSYTQKYLSRVVKINASLQGMNERSSVFTFPFCHRLHFIKVKLSYNHLDCKPNEALPSYLEVTLDRTVFGAYYGTCRAVSIGGFSGNMRTAEITKDWPGDWNRDINGEYEATIDLTDAKIEGIKAWTLLIRNSFPRSGQVSYSFEATFLFCGAYDTCGPVPNDLPSEFEDPNDDILDGVLLNEHNNSYEIPFHKVQLWVRDKSPKGSTTVTDGLFSNARNLSRNRETIGVLTVPNGILQAVRIQVYRYPHERYSGTDFWLLAVIITPPGQRKVVQVGGSHWLGRTDNFLFRQWPNTWKGKYSELEFSTVRDVSSAVLTGEFSSDRSLHSSPNQGSLTVELAFGSNYREGPIGYYGTVTLYFAECSSGNSCSKNVIKVDSTKARAPAINDISLIIQSLLGLLCLVFLYYLATASRKTRSVKLREKSRGLRVKYRPEMHSDYGALHQ